MKKVVAEALGKVALVERDLTTTYKASCLNALESWRFDKIYCLPSSPTGCLVAEKGSRRAKYVVTSNISIVVFLCLGDSHPI